MTGVSFSICSFIYIIVFAVVYFGKQRINLVENKVYTYLLITTIIGLSIDIIGYFAFQDGQIDSVKNIMIAKIYLVYYFTWTLLLTTYTIVVSTKNKNMNYKNLFRRMSKVYIIIAIIILLLNIKIENTGTTLYSYGPSVNLVYMLSGVCVTIMVICILLNWKNIKSKEYIPLLVFILFGATVMIIQYNWPEILLLITCHSLVTGLMYFTIENPDLQMVEELNKNRKLTEQNFEEKSNFLFKISQDLKQPLLEIVEISNNMIETSKGETKEQAVIINNSSKQLYTYVNSALDVSNMDIKNLKIINNRYNTKHFFEEIKLRIKTELKNQGKDIEFRTDISNNIPEILKGDNIKLKQVILSIMFDSIKHTENGFVELTVNSIVKYGICRLIIEISDSGCGMGLEKINNILNTTEELTPEEIEKIDKLNINLPLAHKIVKTINGNFIIKSEINKGTNFLIIVDQKVEEKKQTLQEKKLEKYTNKIISNNKIMLVSVNNKTIDQISKKLSDESITTVISLYGKDCINKIQEDNKYKAIIIDDELKNESGIEILNQLKQIKNQIPTIIIIKQNKEFMAHHYIEDGFDEYLIEENIEEEIKKINKYL